jgi:O-antigen/teichoic acid export membrane protein
MRTKSSLKNILFAIIGQLSGILISFVSRKVFIIALGPIYLGVNGLFNNILTMLSLAELGIGIAIVYSMYKPLAEKNEIQIKALMNFYALAYRYVGIVVLILGLCLLPFLEIFIKGQPDIPHLNSIYLLFLANSVGTYFLAYKRSIIIADQKSYLLNIYQSIFLFLTNLIQIIVILITKSFITFLIIQLIMKVIENILISRKADKLYPYIKSTKGEKLDLESKNSIFKNIKALAYHKIGSIITNATDSIVISTFVGIISVGIYSNYLIIISALNGLLSQVFQSVTASIGNLNVLEKKDKTYDLFKSIFLVNFWLFGFCCIALMNLFNPFIELWIGKDFLLDKYTVIIIVINFYLTGMRKTSMSFKNAIGLFWNDRFKAIYESIINLVSSLILVHYWGIAGVLIGTIISNLLTCFWIEPYVLYKHSFMRNLREYFYRYILYSVLLVINGFVTYCLIELVPNFGIYYFIVKCIICLIVPNIIFILFFYKTKEFNYFYKIFSSFMPKNLNFLNSFKR